MKGVVHSLGGKVGLADQLLLDLNYIKLGHAGAEMRVGDSIYVHGKGLPRTGVNCHCTLLTTL